MTKHILIADILSEAGSSAAKALANKGWQITGISACGGEGVDYVCNLMNRSEVMALVGRIEVEKGDVFGLLVSTAFQLPGVPFLDAAPDIWQARLDAWLRYATNICYACGRKMVARQEGRIMVITPDFNRIKGDCVVEATAAGSLHGFLKSFGAEAAAACCFIV